LNTDPETDPLWNIYVHLPQWKCDIFAGTLGLGVQIHRHFHGIWCSLLFAVAWTNTPTNVGSVV
jgi:hypothetical protein